MAEIRKRKTKGKKAAVDDTGVLKNGIEKKGKGSPKFGEYQEYTIADLVGLVRLLSTVVGVVLIGWIGYWFAGYVLTLHENQLWFTNIKEMEREISLRTESGLYYSYYKQFVKAPTVRQGFSELLYDNDTEHGRTINILKRFNVYQEVILALFYRYLPLSKFVEPIIFYVYACFYLTGLYCAVAGLTAYYVTGNWLAGILASCWFVANLDDSTRVFFTVNLRETFAFPFLWLQFFAVSVYLDMAKERAKWLQYFCLWSVLKFGLLFALCWQFNQFIFLLQAMSIFAVGLLTKELSDKCIRLLVLQAASLLLTCVFQFGQKMILGSLVLSFIPVACLALKVFHRSSESRFSGLNRGVLRLFVVLSVTALLTLALNFAVKLALRIDADTHVYKFLLGKFGLANPTDFESRLYLCHGAFVFLDAGYFKRTLFSAVLPAYIVACLAILAALFTNVVRLLLNRREPKEWTEFCQFSPSVVYLTSQSVLCGIVAVTTLRMKYLWFPHMAVLASYLLLDDKFYTLFKVGRRYTRLALKAAVCGALLAYLIWYNLPTYREQMNDLKEFWDPDTVELMDWINKNSEQDAAFTGSMQLLAGVKCCTGRRLTNHPHFEDKWLRQRTRRLYEIYGRLPPQQVHEILKQEGTDYIILEDSICLAESDGCRLPDLIDLEHGFVPANGMQLPALTTTTKPLFCDEIRKGRRTFETFFKLVLENPTFRVYQLIK